jgi:hypothetical protein
MTKISTLGLIVIVTVITASAVAAQTLQPSQIMTVSPVNVTLPAGAHPSGGPIFEIPRVRMLLSDAELERLSRQPSAATDVKVFTPKAAPAPSISTNCVTNSSTGFFPSDIIGAVGPTNLVVTTNVDIFVYNKSTCGVVASNSLNGFCGALSGEQYFGAQVLWDNTNQRFIVTANSTFNSGPNQNQCFAVSADSAGLSYSRYNIPIINSPNTFCTTATTDFWDYPHVGSVNGTQPRWMITANLLHNNNTAEGRLITIEKGATLIGGQPVIGCFNFSSIPFNLTPTNVTDNNSTAYLLSPGSGGGSSIARWALSPGDLFSATSSISITPWTNPPKAVQPNGEILDTLDGRFVAATIQNGTNLWNVHNVSNGGPPVGVIRPYQFSTTGTSPVNFTTIGAGSAHLFNVSIATNGTLAFINTSLTGPATPGGFNPTMQILVMTRTFRGLVLGDTVATSSSQFTNCGTGGGCRWGDNSSIQIDPSNINNAWGFNQLVTGTSQSNWGTRGAVENAHCIAIPPPQAGPLVATHDFNADCTSDILWYNTATGQAVAWLLSGTSVIGGGSLGSAPSPWAIVGQRDFNGDGFSDILWRNGTTGQLVVWLLDFGSVMGGGSPGSAASPWTVAGTGDFNGDGMGDVLWYNTSTGQIVLWFLNGASLIGGGSPGGAASPWTVAGTGDFNGDGRTDILWYNTNTGQAVIWLLDGTSLIGGGSPGAAGGAWAIAGTGDFNGDGKSDILWYNSTTGQVVIWFLNGPSVIGGGSPGSAGSPWTIAQTGDFNGDGMSDILWSNTSTGQVVIWLLNGTSVIGDGSPGGAASPWTIAGMNAD